VRCRFDVLRLRVTVQALGRAELIGSAARRNQVSPCKVTGESQPNPSTPGRFARVSLFFPCRGDAIRRPARASARRVCTESGASNFHHLKAKISPRRHGGTEKSQDWKLTVRKRYRGGRWFCQDVRIPISALYNFVIDSVSKSALQWITFVFFYEI